MSEVIKSYKGFNRDLTCRGKQYEVGKEYEEEDAEACECGMHACEYPLDCLGYYDPAHSVYHEVEQSGKLSRRSNDSKVASTKMKIGAEISIAGMVKAAIEQFREMGLAPVIYRSAVHSVNKKQAHRIGYYGAIPNQQFDYDHKDDAALYLDH